MEDMKILEILGYLSIRNKLHQNSKEELVDAIKDISLYEFDVDAIIKIIQEGYHIVYPDTIPKIREMIQTYRFDKKNMTKELNMKVNSIIDTLNESAHFTETEIKEKVDNFYTNEFVARSMPIIPIGCRDVIDALVDNDIHYFMASYVPNHSPAQDEDGTFAIEDPFSYIAMINLITCRFPEFLMEDDCGKQTIDNLNKLLTQAKFSYRMRKYIKRTIVDIDYVITKYTPKDIKEKRLIN